MGESAVPCLQESVSFGRFEHDELCWERWSTFPTNKYLEEVEKCSTPGSVAQKKAYFEAHYKRVAARKAELLDLERNRETELMSSEGQCQTLLGSGCNSSEDQCQASLGSGCNTSEDEVDVVKSNNQHPASGTELEDEEDVLDYGEEVFDERNEVASFTSGFSEHNDEELRDGVDMSDENRDLQLEVEEVCGDLCPQMEKAELVFVDEVSSTPELQDIEDFLQDREREIADREAEDVIELNGFGTMHKELVQDKVEEREISELQTEDVKKLDSSKEAQKESPAINVEESEVAIKKTENPRKMQKEVPLVKCEENKAPVKLGNPKKVQKETTVKRTTNTTTNAKKRPESQVPKNSSRMPKSPMLETPKSLRPLLSKSAMSTTRSSVKKESGFTPLNNKKTSRPETKRALPTSLHMSLSQGPANSDTSTLMTTRKSLIMETMGDKEIVKRAFKSFQNSNHLSPSSLTKTPATKQLCNKKNEKGSALDTSEKKYEGITKASRPSSSIPRQVGIKKTVISPGFHKTAGMDQRNGNSIPALDPKCQDKGHKQKEVSKNLEQKSKTKEAGKTYLQTQSKLEKPTPSEDINFKAKLSSSCNLGRGFLRGLQKNDSKIQPSGR